MTGFAAHITLQAPETVMPAPFRASPAAIIDRVPSIESQNGVLALEHKRVKVDIAFITPGMFVAQLDRSWLESPFAVHGFEISDEGQIHLLRKFCKYVYIDVVRSSLDDKQILAARASRTDDPFSQPASQRQVPPSNGAGGFIGGLMRRLGLNGSRAASESDEKRYHTMVSAKKEVRNATAAYGHAIEQMNEILADVKNGAGVNVDKLRDAVSPMVDSIVINPDAMSWLCYLRNRADGGLCLTVTSAVWAVILGRHLGFERYALINLAMGGSLLDIGNTNIPESIVRTAGPPSEDEEEILRMHVEYGVKIVKFAPGINDDIIAMIQCHHERHDGSGYPNGLVGNDIPAFGRIAGLVNCYDVMITDKRYGTPKSSYDAIRELNSLGGKQFQNELVQHFVQAVGMFPTGSLVELHTGEVAMVVEQNQARGLRPRLMIVLDKDKERLASGKYLDLSKVPDSGTKRKARWIVNGYEAGAFDIDPKRAFFE